MCAGGVAMSGTGSPAGGGTPCGSGLRPPNCQEQPAASRNTEMETTSMIRPKRAERERTATDDTTELLDGAMDCPPSSHELATCPRSRCSPAPVSGKVSRTLASVG
ncbi:Uncharacterised protein [Mycobacteroides abscessus subsp. abscessus]|nr:Uncharacterised protein [Mycobacteroides abscessus subsp. abscessus]